MENKETKKHPITDYVYTYLLYIVGGLMLLGVIAINVMRFTK